MAETQSNQVSLGTVAPDFTLYDPISGKLISYHKIDSDIVTVVMFLSNHCPYVKHINQQLVDLATEYIPRGVSFVGISSNDPKAYHEDSPGQMAIVSERLKYPFPYLFDETQEVAKAYNAACTPDFFVYDKFNRLVYHGQLDDSRPSNNIAVTGKDIRHALNLVLTGSQIMGEQRPSVGCSIKWKKSAIH